MRAPVAIQVSIANRRTLVRIAFSIVDVALAVTTAVLLVAGDKSWWVICFSLASFACLTYLAGWAIPAKVDSWQRHQRQRSE